VSKLPLWFSVSTCNRLTNAAVWPCHQASRAQARAYGASESDASRTASAMPCSLSMQPCSPVAAKLVAESLQSQINVQLCKNWDICCCSTCSTCSTCKKPLEREKGTTLFVTLQHWIISVNNQTSARTIRPQWIKEGESSVSLGHLKKHGLSHCTGDIKNEGGKYYIIWTHVWGAAHAQREGPEHQTWSGSSLFCCGPCC